jgi:predicted nuclease of restriction endonuclease-like (RecB) superfamily
MKNKSTPAKRTATAKTKPGDLAALIVEVRDLIHSARRGVASVVDTFQVMTNFEIGRRIVEHEQKGAKRAAYGAEVLKELSTRLEAEFGRGFSLVNLSNMRRFFLLWQERAQILQSTTEKLSLTSSQSRSAPGRSAIVQAATEKSGSSPFCLSWTHYVELLGIKDPDERSFYEIESANSGWNVRELKRQKASCLYERLALSRDQAGIKRLAREGQLITKPEDLFKEPLVLEFLGLKDRTRFSESDLESALISHLEKFLLELGKGFLFEARQKRFTFDGDHYFLDLVFYNRLLRCYVVIDLKLDKLTHQDLGQMQIHPVRYELPIRICPSKFSGRQLLRRIHQRPQTKDRRASRWARAFHGKALAHRFGLLRSVSNSDRRYQAGEIPQNRLGKTLHKVAPRRLSHGVNVNYYDREVKLPGENPTIGLLLCKEKKDAIVKLTLPKDANIQAKDYQLYLPSKEILRQQLLDWADEADISEKTPSRKNSVR